ncbi:hypothetical protein HYDPIDRAFT_112757 [Hydnomerulius pinastri MD-312]|uniref:Uncharacterized protein n=1 Tax=Hydnomerulius pinastri MD-312 TaxID=994086 RepID=A0A0C9VE40_9AGAM|nr:hypothetical protein HYDPIDRAFT_112757 [Hydnomerulius pinastri MD-312]
MSTLYNVPIDSEHYNIWDTAGLNPGSYVRPRLAGVAGKAALGLGVMGKGKGAGSADMNTATRNLERLLQLLDKEGGIQLLVYVVRGSTVDRSLVKNYTIFYSAISRKTVPIVLVVTGLENEEGEMEDWWREGEKILTEYEMRFDAHACVTTLPEEKTRDTALAERGRHSQAALRNLIKTNCRHGVVHPRDTKLWISRVLADVRSLMTSGQKVDRQAMTNVVLCGGEGLLVNTALVGEWESCSTLIGGRAYTFHNASRALGSQGRGTPIVRRGRGPDLLVYVPRSGADDITRLRTFGEAYHEDMCPLVIIAVDEESAEGWRRQVRERGIAATVTHIPSSTTSDGPPLQQVQEVIADHCLVRGLARAPSRRREVPEASATGQGGETRSLPGIKRRKAQRRAIGVGQAAGNEN